MVTVDTSMAQLLYDTQRPWHFNSEVRGAAVLDQLQFNHLGINMLALKGVKAEATLPTTKIGTTARGGFQAEVDCKL